MTKTNPKTFNKTESKKITTSKITYQVGLSLLALTATAYAVPGDIPVMKTLLEKLVPYLGFAFTAGGVYYSGMNGKQVVTGDYRAAPRLLVSVGATGLGLAGIFGANALTVLLP